MLNALAKSKNLEIYNNNTSLYTQYVHSPLSLFVFFWTKLNEILTPFLKSNFQTTLFSTFLHYEAALTSLQPPGWAGVGDGVGGVKTLVTVGQSQLF